MLGLCQASEIAIRGLLAAENLPQWQLSHVARRNCALFSQPVDPA